MKFSPIKTREGNGIIRIWVKVEGVMVSIKTHSTSLTMKSIKIKVEFITKHTQLALPEGKEGKKSIKKLQ